MPFHKQRSGDGQWLCAFADGAPAEVMPCQKYAPARGIHAHGLARVTADGRSYRLYSAPQMYYIRGGAVVKTAAYARAAGLSMFAGAQARQVLLRHSALAREWY